MTCQCWTAEIVVADETGKLQAVKQKRMGAMAKSTAKELEKGYYRLKTEQTYQRQNTRWPQRCGLFGYAKPCVLDPSVKEELAFDCWNLQSLSKTVHSTDNSSTWHEHVTKEYRNHYGDQQASWFLRGFLSVTLDFWMLFSGLETSARFQKTSSKCCRIGWGGNTEVAVRCLWEKH